MNRILTLTSPLTSNMNVERAQRILTNTGYFVGSIDGVFGEVTGRACTEAKFKLGYAKKNIIASYGPDLEDFLTKRKRRTPAMLVRARQRSKRKPFGEAAIDIAKQYIGTKENPPNSNRVLFSEWYGIIGPWCAMFVTYCFSQGGSKAFARGERWAYCPSLLNDATAQRNGVTKITKAQAVKGDVVLYSWNRDGVANHVGIMLTPVDNNGGFSAIEGNTSPASDSNGGEVMIRQRNARDVVGFVRVVR